MNKLFQEFKILLKDISVEELVDIYIFRPFAFLIVKIISRFPITPNQLSFIAMFFGVICGIFYSKGDPTSFVIAGLLYGFIHIMDCCDGMIARLKNCGTLNGRIIDGFGDYFNALVIYVGLAFGLSKAAFEFVVSPWLLMVFAAICTTFNAMVFDYYKNEFMAHALGKMNSTQEDIDLFIDKLRRLKQVKGKFYVKFVIRVYLIYSKVQMTKTTKMVKYDPQTYYKKNQLLIRLLGLIGPTSHILVLMISSFLYKLEIFFYYTFVAANIWTLIIWMIQIRNNKEIAIKP